MSKTLEHKSNFWHFPLHKTLSIKNTKLKDFQNYANLNLVDVDLFVLFIERLHADFHGVHLKKREIKCFLWIKHNCAPQSSFAAMNLKLKIPRMSLEYYEGLESTEIGKTILNL